MKTKHPQLHYESKLYMLLQGGSKFLFLLLLSIMSWNERLFLWVKINLYALIYLLSVWSGYPPFEMVWRWGRVQCYGYWPSWPKPRRPVQLLQPEVFFKNGFNACRSVGKNLVLSMKEKSRRYIGQIWVPYWFFFFFLLFYVDKQSWVYALTGFSSPWYKAWQLFDGFRAQS